MKPAFPIVGGFENWAKEGLKWLWAKYLGYWVGLCWLFLRNERKQGSNDIPRNTNGFSNFILGYNLILEFKYVQRFLE